jgi:hypothetical protein
MSELAKALAKAQASFPAIERSKTVTVRTKTGQTYTFAYAPLDAITHAVAGPLAANDLAYSQLLSNIDGAAALRTVLMHSSGETIEDVCPLPINGGVSAQEFGSLVTYMRRYALVALLGIATEEDDDGNAASGNTAEVRARQGSGNGSSAVPPETDAAKFSEARPDMTEQEYLALVEIAQLPDALPSQQVVHFGKNKGALLGELTPRQLGWYANDWEFQPDPSPYDFRLKAAAQALHAGADTPDFTIPF